MAVTVIDVKVRVSPVELDDAVPTATLPGPVQVDALVLGPQTSKTIVPVGAADPVRPVTVATSWIPPLEPRPVVPVVVVAVVLVVVPVAVTSTHSVAFSAVRLSEELPV